MVIIKTHNKINNTNCALTALTFPCRQADRVWSGSLLLVPVSWSIPIIWHLPHCPTTFTSPHKHIIDLFIYLYFKLSIDLVFLFYKNIHLKRSMSNFQFCPSIFLKRLCPTNNKVGTETTYQLLCVKLQGTSIVPVSQRENFNSFLYAN